MRYPTNEFSSKWYIAFGFGEKTDYGFHDGADINLKTGGDTDLGEPLLAICGGQVTSVHEHTTIPSFGKHLHIKFESPFGIRWVHYAHCQEILVKEDDLVTEGQVVARLGKSGTKVAHCHFAIKRQPTGVDGIAKTQTDLEKWENPIEFIEKCIAHIDDKYRIVFQGTEVATYESNPIDKINDLENQVKTLNEEVATARLEVNSLSDALKDQERDNAELSKQILESRNQRDQAIREKKDLEGKVESLTQSISSALTEQKRLSEALVSSTSLTIKDIPSGKLIKEVIMRLVRKK